MACIPIKIFWNWLISRESEPQPCENGEQEALLQHSRSSIASQPGLSTSSSTIAPVSIDTENISNFVNDALKSHQALESHQNRQLSTTNLTIPENPPRHIERTTVSPSSIRSFKDQIQVSPEQIHSRGDGQYLRNVGTGLSSEPSDTIVPTFKFNSDLDENHVSSQRSSSGAEDQELSLALRLWNSRFEWPKGADRHFIPAKTIHRLITTASVKDELRVYQVELPGRNFSETDLERIASNIVDGAMKLFTILVCQSLGSHIFEFLVEGLDDQDLPFVRFPDNNTASNNFKLRSRKNPDKPIRCMEKWGIAVITAIGRDQWWVLAPIFQGAHEKVRHWELEDNCVLPYIFDEEHTEKADAGGFSSVWGVRIHHDHQLLHRGTNPKEPNPWIAVKRLHSTKKEDFRLEVEMLKNFSSHQNKHLVKLLATYRLKGRYHLMFPKAASNLRAYWKKTPTPTLTQETVKWVLVQCKGIASGIMAIHEYRNSGHQLPNTDEVTQLQPSQRLGDNLLQSSPPVELEGIYGRHGDIKPENILWSQEDVKDEHGNSNVFGMLLIADFGLMDFHRKNTRSMVACDGMKGSATYEPPERQLKVKISRAYDIWSLGCVYLEFITWLVAGNEELMKFPYARGETGLEGVNDDTFYSLHQDFPNAAPYAIVRPAVTQWIDRLHEMPRCSQFIHDFLDVISKHMLVVRPAERIHCGPLNEKLQVMCEQSQHNAEYLTKPAPRVPLVARDDDDIPPPSPTDGSAIPRRDILSGIDAIAMSPPLNPMDRPMSPSFQFTHAPIDGS